MIRVSPVHHTAHPDWWQRLLRALGAVQALDDGQRREYDTASGTIAISSAAGESALGFVTTAALPTLLSRLEAAGVDARMDEDAAAIRVHAASGVSFLVSAARRAPLDVGGGLAVLPIWYQSDVAETARVYAALGLRPRIASDDPGGWTDYTADGGGLVAQHRADRIAVDATSLEYAGDLDDLATRVRDAGFEASVVDEAYNRTLLVASPDGGHVWVNGPQDDLYGYHRAG